MRLPLLCDEYYRATWLFVNRRRIREGKHPYLRLPKGVRNEAWSCPIAHALHTKVMPIPNAGLALPGFEFIPNPNLAHFAIRFDCGLYPGLEL